MQRSSTLFASALLVACAPKGSFDGKLLDPLTRAGRADVTVVLQSPTNPTPSCMEIEVVTDADGHFLAEGLCANGDYSITFRDKTLLLQDMDPIPGGVLSTGMVEVMAWSLPPGDGLWSFDGSEWIKLRTIAAIGSATIWKTDEKVTYPDTLPTRVVHIPKTKWLVFGGDRFVMRHEFLPLIRSERRRFGSPAAPEPSEPWWYCGVEFKSDTVFERKPAKIDASKARQLKQGSANLHYIAGDGVPTGHYVMYGERDKRLYMVNMGDPIPAPGAE